MSLTGKTLSFQKAMLVLYVDFQSEKSEPRMFSFNSPFGACPTCDGLGQKLTVDVDLVVPDKDKTLKLSAIEPWIPTSSDFYPTLLKRVCEVYKINMDKPFKKLTERQRDILLYGSGDKEIEFTFTQRQGGTRKRTTCSPKGVVPNISRRFHESPSEYTRK